MGEFLIHFVKLPDATGAKPFGGSLRVRSNRIAEVVEGPFEGKPGMMNDGALHKHPTERRAGAQRKAA